jgi:drug/metabolite transporter (DMT)-like permease
VDFQLNVLIAITIICWGAWGIADKKAVDCSTAPAVFLAVYIFAIPLVPLALLTLHTFEPSWHLGLPLLFWTGLGTFAYTIATAAYLLVLKRIEASYVLGITAAYPIVLQFLADIFLHEPVVPSRVAGAALIGLGVAAIGKSAQPGEATLKGCGTIRCWTCIAVATVGWGIWGLFDKEALHNSTPLAAFAAHRIWDVVVLVVVGLVFLARGWQVSLRPAAMWKFAALSVAMTVTASWTFLKALSVSSASYVVSITGCYPLVMYLLALWLLKEPVNRIRLAGIGLVVAGGILVQLTQAV